MFATGRAGCRGAAGCASLARGGWRCREQPDQPADSERRGEAPDPMHHEACSGPGRIVVPFRQVEHFATPFAGAHVRDPATDPMH
jgi:hypothetical protein